MNVRLDDIMNAEDQRAQLTDRALTLLPDPEPREVWCPIISVDDHVLEPPTLFDTVPKKLRGAAPKLVEERGRPAWRVGDRLHFLSGTDGTAGRPTAEWNVTGMRWEDYRPGTYDVHARIADMDLNGVWASLGFPSNFWGFAGTTLSRLPDPDVALACVRAYNDWVFDWCSTYRDRLIPCQVPFLADAELAAQEIRRNAARGMTAVSFSENPHGLDLPSIHSGYWDPLLAACADTGTVVNLHVGSSGTITRPSPDSPPLALAALFPVNGMMAVVDWIFSRIPLRFPTIRIALSEAGVSWVPTVIERLRSAFTRRELSNWEASDPHPVDVLHRNFWFTSIEDPSAFRLLDLIGEDRVMVETDYPHADTSWPDTQALLRDELGHLPRETITKVCFENAASLYRQPHPPAEMLSGAALLAGPRGGDC